MRSGQRRLREREKRAKDCNILFHRHAGVNNSTFFEEEFEGAKFKVTSGDYAPLMELVNENLEQAVVS